MRSTMKWMTVAGLLVALPACTASNSSSSQPAYGAVGTGQLFENMGLHQRTVTTDSTQAQEYFNQGLIWVYGFNHDEAVRSFTRAAEIDPNCAMAWWGVALAQGPNYNSPITNAGRDAAAWDALQHAVAQVDNETQVERDLIEALSHRYADPPPRNRSTLNRAYADAMARVWEAHPNDSDVGTLYAYALMVQRPWRLYTHDKQPAEDTIHFEETLERVMAMDPGNPGANHLYIHAVEASSTPERGVPAADRLSDQAPIVGHIGHMPCHIYVQSGHWQRALEQSAMAMAADQAYLAKAPRAAIPYRSMIHNAHMRGFAAMMVGREDEAISSMRAMWNIVPPDLQRNVYINSDHWMCGLWDVYKRFGRWDELLEDPGPPDYLPLTSAAWRAHRAIAYAAKHDFDNAQREYDAFLKAKNAMPSNQKWARGKAHNVLNVAEYFVRGEIALQHGQWDRAADLLEQAAAIEDTILYGEPPRWLQPVRHTLGAVYMAAGRYADAERVYRRDLAKWRENGWSLFGLSRALEEQGKIEQALAVHQQFQRAWSSADQMITTSCQCIPET